MWFRTTDTPSVLLEVTPDSSHLPSGDIHHALDRPYHDVVRMGSGIPSTVPPSLSPLSHGWGGGADPSSLHPPAVRPALPPSRIGAWSSCSRRDPFPWNWGVVCPFEWLNRGELHPLGTKVHGNLGIGSPRYHLHPPQHTWCNARTSKDNVPREARGWPSLGHADQAIRREVEVAWAKERHEEEPRDRAGKRIGTVASVSGKRRRKKKEIAVVDRRKTHVRRTGSSRNAESNVDVDRRTTHVREQVGRKKLHLRLRDETLRWSCEP